MTEAEQRIMEPAEKEIERLRAELDQTRAELDAEQTHNRILRESQAEQFAKVEALTAELALWHEFVELEQHNDCPPGYKPEKHCHRHIDCTDCRQAYAKGKP